MGNNEIFTIKLSSFIRYGLLEVKYEQCWMLAQWSRRDQTFSCEIEDARFEFHVHNCECSHLWGVPILKRNDCPVHEKLKKTNYNFCYT